LSTLSISLPRASRHNPLATTGAVLIIIFLIFALFAPWIAPQDPAYIVLLSLVRNR
jgi:peptide/nickel transport system permease protein